MLAKLTTGGFHDAKYAKTYVDTDETFDGTAWTSNPIENPEERAMAGHCMVKINASSILSIGGIIDLNPTKNSSLYNIQSNRWTPGPMLYRGRYQFSCGILRWKNPESNQFERVILAAGGFYYFGTLSYVELLYLNDDDSVKGEWVIGPGVKFINIL